MASEREDDDYEDEDERAISESSPEPRETSVEGEGEEVHEDFVAGEFEDEESETVTPTDQLHALAMELNAFQGPPVRRAVGRANPTGPRYQGPVPVQPAAASAPFTSRWKTTARPASEARGTAVVLPKEERHLLSKDQLVKLQTSTTAELSHKFEMMSGQTDDQLAECYNLAVRVDALGWRLKKTDTIGGFDIFINPIDIYGGIPTVMPKTLPLIDFIDDLSLKLVRATMKFKRYYGQDYDLQDLQWSQELLENSCDEALRAKIIEKLHSIPDDEAGGAVFYYVMMQLIRVDTEKAVRGLLDKIGSLSIAKVPGENVCNVVSLIRGVLTRLRAVRMVPFDFTMTIIGIMETSTVAEFTSFFTQMRHTVYMEKMRGRAPGKRFVDKILETAETRYLEMLNSEGTWTGIGTPTSAFMAGGGGTSSTKIICHHCGQEGHIRPNCPKKLAEESSTRTSDKGGGRERGRGGRGRGDGSRWTKSEKGQRKGWKTVSPGTGAPTKTVDGKEFHWCAKCGESGRWSMSHGTADHRTIPTASANVVETEEPKEGTSARVSFAESVVHRAANKIAGKFK
jgi:hypothetical protein